MLWMLLALVAVQLLVGVAASRTVRSEEDFLVAGRRLGLLLATSSIFATWFGAESCVGAAGAAYRDGVGWTTTEPFAYGLCLVLMGLWFAGSLWQRRITTLGDFFAQRYGKSTERAAAWLLLPSSLLWAAAQVRAFGHVVAVNSDGAIGVEAATALAAGVAIAYTVSGGLLADVYTDVVQGALLILGLFVLGGATWAALPAGSPPHLAQAPAAGLGATLEAWAVPICGSLVAQEALSRSLAARSASIARRAAILGGLTYILVGLIPLAIGMVGPRLLPGLADPETILPELSRRLLPQIWNLVFAGALVSAILSTVDSCLLVAASTVTHNLWPAPSTNASRPSRALARARWVVAAAGLVAFALASTQLDVKELVEEASGFASAGVFVLAVMGVHTRIGSTIAANSSLLAGLVVWLVCRHLLSAHVELPYLASLAAAVSAYAAGTGYERWFGRPPHTA